MDEFLSIENRNFGDCSLLFVQNRQGNINPSFLGMLGNENLLGKGSSFSRFNSFDTSLTRFGYLRKFRF